MVPLTIRLEQALEQRARTSHLKPALAPLYKAASAASTGSYRALVCRLGGRRGRATQRHRPLLASNRTNDGHIGLLSMVPRAAGVAGAHRRVAPNGRRWFQSAETVTKDLFFGYGIALI